MKRIFAAPLAALALTLALPAAAVAHHHRHHGSTHASAHHRKHGRRAHVLTFGPIKVSPIQAPTTENENAGTVESFAEGVLTIKLADGKTLESGKVTEATEVRCIAATPPTQTGEDQDDQGDQGENQSGDDQRSGGDLAHADRARAADFSDGGQDQGDDDQRQEGCTNEEALTKGATVRAAELELLGSGPVWERVVTVK
jgi:hypothetical protein